MLAASLDCIALAGRSGILLQDVLAKVDANHDVPLRNHLWKRLQQQAAQEVLSLHTSDGTEAVGTKRKRVSSEATTDVPADVETAAQQVTLVACEELRLRAIGISAESETNELSALHVRVLEVIGRKQVEGVTVPQIAQLCSGVTVKKVHTILDTLLSYNLVEKRLLLIRKKNQTIRLNIVHLPRFAESFEPEMYAPNAAFERDEQSKELLMAAATAYLQHQPNATAVVSDMVRDLGLNRYEARVLYNQPQQPDPQHPFELFQAIFKQNTATRLLYCLRYHPPEAESEACEGLAIGAGLNQQVHDLIEANASVGTTNTDIRDRFGIPGSKLPYRVINRLAESYGLRADSVVLGKSRAFRLFPAWTIETKPDVDDAVKQSVPDETQNHVHEPPKVEDTSEEKLVPTEERTVVLRSGRITKNNVQSQTQTRRRNHVLLRLKEEQLISLASLRKSISNLPDEADLASPDYVTILRLCEALEKDGVAKVMRLKLKSRVTFNATRPLRCIGLPHLTPEDELVQAYCHMYGKQERSRRVEQQQASKMVTIESITPKYRYGGTYASSVKEEGSDGKKALVARDKEAGRRRLRAQNLRLGMAYGQCLRAKRFHLKIWHSLQERADLSEISDDDTKMLLFSQDEMMNSLSLREYMEFFGGGSILSDEEEAIVKQALSERKDFAHLPPAIAAKIRANEVPHTSSMFGILRDLGLVYAYELGVERLGKLLVQSNADEHSPVSRALKAHALGGLYCLNQSVRIDLPGMEAYDKVHVASTIPLKYPFKSEIPIAFSFETDNHVHQYWMAFECLCLEKLQMPSSQNTPDLELVPQPKRTRGRNILSKWSWTVERRVYDGIGYNGYGASSRSVVNVNSILVKTKRNVNKRGKKLVRSSPPDATDAIVRPIRKTKKMEGDTMDQIVWTKEEQERMEDLIMTACQESWTLQVPPTLQATREPVAFRSPSLYRYGFKLTSIANELRKRVKEVRHRVRSALRLPRVKHKLEMTKLQTIAGKNPGGVFFEEQRVMTEPRLTALFRRAMLLMAVSDDEYEALADESLLSLWSIDDVKLVWRYMWLKHWISRSKQGSLRRFCVSWYFGELTKVNTTSYDWDFYMEAAKYYHTFPFVEKKTAFAFADGGLIATTLAMQVMQHCVLQLEFVPRNEPVVGKGFGRKRKRVKEEDVEGDDSKDSFSSHLMQDAQFPHPATVMNQWQVRAQQCPQVDRSVVFEAFSLANEALEVEERGEVEDRVKDIVMHVVQSAMEDGVDFQMLLDRVQEQVVSSRSQVRQCLQWMIDNGVVLAVNGYDCIRYVCLEFKDLWMLHPVSAVKQEDSHVKMEYQSDKETLALPWLKTNGDTNYAFLLSIHRKFVTYITQHPGTNAKDVQSSIDCIFSLQDTREALALLVEAGVLYSRAIAKHPKVSLFGKRQSIQIAKTGHADDVELKYFPHPNGIVRFGTILTEYTPSRQSC